MRPLNQLSAVSLRASRRNRPAAAILKVLTPLVSIVVAFALLSGCSKWHLSKARGVSGNKFFAVQKDNTAFYLHGPGQGAGPDKTLPKDSLVTLIRTSFGFSKVKLGTGEQGYVWNEDIKPASSAVIAASAPRGEPDVGRLTQPNPPDPRLVPPDSLPEFEPTPIPEPPLPEH
ncbi:MAG: hypothetical protein QOH39_2947 [Verrucomicrobiota bacterium]